MSNVNHVKEDAQAALVDPVDAPRFYMLRTIEQITFEVKAMGAFIDFIRHVIRHERRFDVVDPVPWIAKPFYFPETYFIKVSRSVHRWVHRWMDRSTA